MKIVVLIQSLGGMDLGVTTEYPATIHPIHKWLSCNFENFKMSAPYKRSKYQKTTHQNKSLCVFST